MTQQQQSNEQVVITKGLPRQYQIIQDQERFYPQKNGRPFSTHGDPIDGQVDDPLYFSYEYPARKFCEYDAHHPHRQTSDYIAYTEEEIMVFLNMLPPPSLPIDQEALEDIRDGLRLSERESRLQAVRAKRSLAACETAGEQDAILQAISDYENQAKRTRALYDQLAPLQDWQSFYVLEPID